MDLWQHFRIIWRNRWRILIVSLLVAGLVYLRSSSLDEVYAAEALLRVNPARSADGDAPSQDNTLFIARSYAELAETTPVAREAAQRSGLALPVDEAEGRLSVALTGETGFLLVRATGEDGEAAAALADAMAETLVDTVETRQEDELTEKLEPLQDQIALIEGQLATLDEEDPSRESLVTRLESLLTAVQELTFEETDEIEVVALGRTGGGPVTPTPLRDAVLAFLVALVINSELAVLLTVVSGRFSGADASVEITQLTGLPVLARIPRGGGPQAMEAFRALRTNLIFGGDRDNLRTLAVVGAEPGCGKSYTSVNLAKAVSALGARVAVVDADLRRPVVHRMLSLQQAPGLTDVTQPDDVRAISQLVPGDENLWVVSAGSPTVDPSGLLSAHLRTVFRGLEWAELIIVDTPAAELFADAAAIAPTCDATVVVIDARSTRRQAVIETLEALRRVQANVVGVVVNRVDDTPRASYYDRYRDKTSA